MPSWEEIAVGAVVAVAVAVVGVAVYVVSACVSHIGYVVVVYCCYYTIIGNGNTQRATR